MKRKAINPMSDKKREELRLQGEIMLEYAREYGNRCMTCGTNAFWSSNPLTPSHIIAKSRGGKTTKDNLVPECLKCHQDWEKCPEKRPRDSLGYQLYIKQINPEGGDAIVQVP